MKIMEFKEKAMLVAEQFDKWNIPMTLLSKNENIYDLIERMHTSLTKHPVEEGDTYNQWIAKVAIKCYAHYKQKMGEKPAMTREEREKRYQEHKAKFLGK